MDTFHCRVILLAVVAQWKQNPSPTKLFMRRFVVTESWFLEQDSAIIFKRRQTSLQLRSPKHDGVDSVKSQKTYSFAWSDASAMAPFSPVSHKCDPRSELPHRKRSRLLIRWLTQHRHAILIWKRGACLFLPFFIASEHNPSASQASLVSQHHHLHKADSSTPPQSDKRSAERRKKQTKVVRVSL